MDLTTALQQLATNPTAPYDIAELALAVARDEYSHLDVEGELTELKAMAHEVAPRLRGGLTYRVESLSRYLFHEQGFVGNERDYYDPRNSYLNDVLNRRLGLPITLSIITMSVAARCGMEVVGVGLPGHFIVKALDRGQEVYFDPYHGGRILQSSDCEELVERIVGIPFQATPESLASMSVGQMILRVLINLKGVYLKRQDYSRVARITHRICQLQPEDANQLRDLGIALLQAGSAAQAITPLRRYLAQVPPPTDSRAIRELLDEAQGELARWN